MLVRSLNYPEPLVPVDGVDYQFRREHPGNANSRTGLCNIPDGVALKLCGVGASYEIVSTGVSQEEGGFLPFDHKTWTKDYKKIIWDGPLGYSNGYGNGSMMAAEALGKRKDVDLYILASRWQGTVLDHIGEDLQKLLDKNTNDINSYYIKFFPAFEFTRKVASRFIGYTMLEMTRIPKSWAENCNKFCERVIVPCEQQRQAFIDSGVKVDIKSIPLGLKVDKYPVVTPVEDEDFVFGCHGTLTHRKGTDILVRCFLKAFPANEYPNVHLYIKSLRMNGFGHAWFMDDNTFKTDKRIIMNFDVFSPKQLSEDFFGKINCFVFPTRGEGFGLPPLEAMCSSLPVICTNFSGCSEFIKSDVAYPLSYTLEDVPSVESGIPYPMELRAENQQWAKPDEDELISLMREVYNNRDKAKAKGKKAAKFVRKEFSSDVTAQKIVDYLDQKF